MQKLHYSIVINAPKEKVWNTMFEDATYREWTAVFNPSSSYIGDWSKGSKILFLGTDPVTGKEGGMVSRIAENEQNEYISIEHVGIIKDGVEDTTSAEAKKWTPAFENYTFKENDGATEVIVDMDSAEDHVKMFEDMWPKALVKLKELSERHVSHLSPITVETVINAPIEKVWEFWNQPEHIVHWAFASDDWEAPAAENDVRVGGMFKIVMAARDKSARFDFAGTYTNVRERGLIEYEMNDGRQVKVQFAALPEGVRVTETFDPEKINSEEMQRSGWQAILENFKRYVEQN